MQLVGQQRNRVFVRFCSASPCPAGSWLPPSRTPNGRHPSRCATQSPPCKPSGRKASDDSAPETFSDIEEAAIVNTEDDASAAEGFWPAPGAAAVPPGEKHSVQGSADLAAGDTAQGSTAEGGAAGPGGGVGPAGAPSVLVLAPPADFDRLVDLEAACSAVAQEDMEAQGNLAARVCAETVVGRVPGARVQIGRLCQEKGHWFNSCATSPYTQAWCT